MFKFNQTNQEMGTYNHQYAKTEIECHVTETTYENPFYKIVKEERQSIYLDGDIFTNISYDVFKKDGKTEMPTIYIKKDFGNKLEDGVTFKVDVATTSFGGRDLDFIEDYTHKLMYAVSCAREIERMLKDKEL